MEIKTEDDLVGLIELPEWKIILIELVKKEKMDVWNLDVALLAKKYLERIRELKEQNLRIPANAVLACAILLRMKSKQLQLPMFEEEQEYQTLSPEQLAELEQMLPELVPKAKVRSAGISLHDLLSAIEVIMAQTRKKVARQRVSANVTQPEFKAIRITEKDFDEVIHEVYERVKEKADSEGLVLFSQLVEAGDVLKVVTTFTALLFLHSQGKLSMWQEELFGEIFISLLHAYENQPPESQDA
jgi:segregation and condensation protein A